MPRVRAPTVVPGRVVEAEELWYDPHRWAAWVDGFGHVAKLEGEGPQVGTRLLGDSRAQGRAGGPGPRGGSGGPPPRPGRGAGRRSRSRTRSSPASRPSRSSQPTIRYE